MNRVEWLMVAVCLTSFGAGVAVGVAVPAAAAVLGGGDERQRVIEERIDRYHNQFDLRSDQVRDLRAILLKFGEEKVRIATSASYEELPPRLQARHVQAQQVLDDRIFFILDEQQRQRYRELYPEQTKNK